MKYLGRILGVVIGSLVVAILGLLSRAVIFEEKRAEPVRLVQGATDMGKTTDAERPVHKQLFLDKQLFWEGIRRAEIYENNENRPWAGAIIPHHDLPSHLLASFFKSLAGKEIKTIILIGPNHRELGQAKVITGRNNWPGWGGVVLVNQSVVEGLIKSGLAQADEEIMGAEHSVATVMPYIDYYLPESTVVPLILKWGMKREEIDRLANALKQGSGDDTLLLAAVDFSHGLTAREAEEKDQESWAAIQSFAVEDILHLNNEYLDSPTAVAVLLTVMQRLGATNLTLLDQTNSGQLLNDYMSPATGYMFLAFSL